MSPYELQQCLFSPSGESSSSFEINTKLKSSTSRSRRNTREQEEGIKSETCLQCSVFSDYVSREFRGGLLVILNSCVVLFRKNVSQYPYLGGPGNSPRKLKTLIFIAFFLK